MRRSFPILWIFQFIVLLVLGCWTFFYPSGLLQYFRGFLVPDEVERPTETLYSWVLGLTEIDAPDERVREFFSHHDEAVYEDMHVWTPDDPSLDEYVRTVDLSGWRTADTLNVAWEDVETWILSARPAPPAEHADAIRRWVHALDRIPEPSRELREWITSQKAPASPPPELRMLILEGRQVLPSSWRLAAQNIRFASPCIMAAAFFTLLGLMNPHIRRGLARVFVLVCIFWSIAQFDDVFASKPGSIPHGVVIFGLCLGIIIVVRVLNAAPRLSAGCSLFTLIALWWSLAVFAIIRDAFASPPQTRPSGTLIAASVIVAVIGIVNAWYWLVGKCEDPPQDNGGIVLRRPPELWTMWVLQFFLLLCTGLGAMLFPQEVAHLFVRDDFEYLAVDVVSDSVKTLGAWIMAMALFSFFALSVGRDWVWQGISLAFCVVFSLLALGTVQIASSGEYSFWIYVYGFQGVVFIPVTVTLLWRRDPYSNAHVERIKPEDWCLPDLVLAPWLVFSPVLRGRRSLFRTGVGATGTLRVLSPAEGVSPDAPSPPPNAFFAPGRCWPVHARFSNFTQSDDASLDIRGCALRIGAGAHDRLDLFFATGEFAPFATLVDFLRFLVRRNRRKLVEQNQRFREGMAAGVRRAPASFAVLSYYQQLVFEWMTPAAECRLVRFRLVPGSASVENSNRPAPEELGVPDAADLQALWRQERRVDETRSPDYLRRELHARLQTQQQVVFRLEAQFHKQQPGDTLDWYDASIEWETRESPWLPIAELVLDAPQPDYECERQLFDPSKAPLTLSVPRPDRLTSFVDPRALASARYRIGRYVGRARTWRSRFLTSVAERKADMSADMSAEMKVDVKAAAPK